MQGPATVSTKLRRIAELARNAPDMAFTSLSHHIDFDFLHEAYRRTRKDGAPGVDGQTAAQYAKGLEGNLRNLLERFKAGTYRAPPVRRVHIPKGDGTETRPIGIPTIEDKILQRAVTMALEAVYEQDFLTVRAAFGPSGHTPGAPDPLERGDGHGRGWVLEVDIRKFFDSLDHAHLRAILDQRVRDGVLRRTIDKWLKAGVLEEDARDPRRRHSSRWSDPRLLANVYLHGRGHVVRERDPTQSGRQGLLVRYADDPVIVRFGERRAPGQGRPPRAIRCASLLHPEKTAWSHSGGRLGPPERAKTLRHSTAGLRLPRLSPLLGATRKGGGGSSSRTRPRAVSAVP
ncbi:MAG: reverse transcriptase domain-containing protein [Planctomycetes bacterium]|nr:reverse transcriptase domain-containing protein [Planctomycetota bacterium]